MLEMILIAAALILDQWSKHWAQATLLSQPGHTIPVIQDVFHLTYVENRGAAFSILQGKRTFFLIMTAVLATVLVVVLLRNRKQWGTWLRVAFALLIAGALGNGIDRLLLGYVRDLFDFRAIGFPVFNVADSALTAAVIMLAIHILFWDKDKKKAAPTPEAVDFAPDGAEEDGVAPRADGEIETGNPEPQGRELSHRDEE